MIGADKQILRRRAVAAVRVRSPELYAAVGDEIWQEFRTELLRELRRAAEGHDPADAELAEVVAEIREAGAPEAVEPARRREPEAVAWLREHLANGPRRGRDVYAAALAAGFSRRTVERARRPAGVRAPRGPGSRWERVS